MSGPIDVKDLKRERTTPAVVMNENRMADVGIAGWPRSAESGPADGQRAATPLDDVR
jgi:hypothetical protein